MRSARTPGRPVIVIALVVLALSGCAGDAAPAARPEALPPASAPPVLLPTLDPAQVQQGAVVYAAQCAACHGPDGEGEPNWRVPKPDGAYPAPPHDASGHTWHHSDRLLIQIIAGGGDSLNLPNFKSNMPGFGHVLGEDEIVAVLTYLKSLWPEEQRRYQFEASLMDPLP